MASVCLSRRSTAAAAGALTLTLGTCGLLLSAGTRVYQLLIDGADAQLQMRVAATASCCEPRDGRISGQFQR